MASPPAAQLPRKRTPASAHSAFVDELASRFSIDEPAHFITNGLSTELVCYPSDAHPARAGHLNRKIRRAKLYSTQFRDIEALNALLYLPEKPPGPKPQTRLLTLGLYLYLADECSRLGADKTLLSAMREAGAEYKDESEQKWEPGELLTRTLAAIESLGLTPDQRAPMENAVREWAATGSYTVEGEPHNFTEGGLTGAYAQLASLIAERQHSTGMNFPISYALGNKPAMQGLDGARAYAHTQRSVSHGEAIDRRIAAGHLVRRARIREAVREVLPAREGMARPQVSDFARRLFDSLPDNLLTLLAHEGYSFAYSTGPDIGACYPAHDLPGLSKNQNTSARGSKAMRQKRYDLIFLSNGIRRQAGDVERDEELRLQVVAQSLVHESMHIVQSYLTKDENAELQRLAEALHNDMAPAASPMLDERLRTIDTNTLRQVLDYTSRLYTNYGKGADTRWEEVVCNLAGLMHSEFSAASGRSLDEVHLPSLDALRRGIEDAIETAAARCAGSHPRGASPARHRS